MGLSLEVGFLAWQIAEDPESAKSSQRVLKKLNTVLKANKLPKHDEPEVLPPLKSRAKLTSYPYSYLHYLRRFAAHAIVNRTKKNWKPKPFRKTSDPSTDPLIADCQSMLDNHLMCHSDCEGWYVPIDFQEPIFTSEPMIPGGGMIGSSHGLLRELIDVSAHLKIELSEGVLSNAEAKRINTIGREEGDFWIEHVVWISLFEACRLSIEHKTLITFL